MLFIFITFSHRSFYNFNQLKKVYTLAIILLLLCIPTTQQRGGGGGGRGGGGGGGRGGGGGGRGGFGGGGSHGYRKYLNLQLRPCRQECGAIQACIDQCDRKQRLQMFIWQCIFGAFATIFLLGTLCSCYGERLTSCGICSYFKFRKLKKQFNNVSPGLMSIRQFNAKRDQILQWLNKRQNNFSYSQYGETYYIQTQAAIVQQKDYLTEISIHGKDTVGEWRARGFITCHNEGQILMWFYKEYNNKFSAGQVGDWAHLVYKSATYEQGKQMAGKWYYSGFENRECGAYYNDWSLTSCQKYKRYPFDEETQNGFENSKSQL